MLKNELSLPIISGPNSGATEIPNIRNTVIMFCLSLAYIIGSLHPSLRGYYSTASELGLNVD